MSIIGRPLIVGGGYGATLVVTAPTGSTVTCTDPNGTTLSVSETSGTWVFSNLMVLGTYTIRGSLSGSQATKQKVISQYTSYTETIIYTDNPKITVTGYLPGTAANNSQFIIAGTTYLANNSMSYYVNNKLERYSNSIILKMGTYGNPTSNIYVDGVFHSTLSSGQQRSFSIPENCSITFAEYNILALNYYLVFGS